MSVCTRGRCVFARACGVDGGYWQGVREEVWRDHLPTRAEARQTAEFTQLGSGGGCFRKENNTDTDWS